MDYQFSVEKITIKNTLIYEATEITIPVQGITVIVGRNGCGKTTLLNHIIHSNPEQIALIAQENDLIFNDMSIEDNIMLFNTNREKLSELLSMFEIEYILERNPRHLSGGEKRMIALLRMFFIDKDVVFLDEPTNDLDYRSVEKVKTIISQLATQKSLLIVTHDERISSLGNKIYSFFDGVIMSDEDTKDKEYCKMVNKKTEKTIGKLVNRDFVGNLLFALMIISIVSSGFFAIITHKDEIDCLKNEQTNICSKFYAGIDAMIENGYIPLEAYKSYEGKIDENFLNVYYDSLEMAGSQGGSLNMFIDKQVGNEVFLAIFFDAITNKKICLMQEYQSLRGKYIGKEPDISKYVSVFDGVSEVASIPQNGVEEKIVSSIYYMLEEAYIENYTDYQPVLYIVIGIDEQQIDEIEGNVFIKNNITVEICNSINRMRTFLNSLTVLGVGLLGSILFYFLYISITIKLYKKHIIILRNFGVSQDVVKSEIFRKKCTPIVKMVITSVGLLICIISMYVYKEYILVMSLIATLSAIVGIGVIVVSQKIIVRNIYKIYNYGGIYEY